ncbi:hypothetical protein AVEN_230626-1 [Araneus ventricosus]|uniref:Uncharacterized protein n=1 Tax=Araneus ventricosus TaxID=182803 RepID=A0A4Y2A2J1_ARAVE|nr:hypothetical protein AVEN_230626-1 [Araneus ventricosus]
MREAGLSEVQELRTLGNPRGCFAPPPPVYWANDIYGAWKGRQKVKKKGSRLLEVRIRSEKTWCVHFMCMYLLFITVERKKNLVKFWMIVILCVVFSLFDFTVTTI